MEGMGCDSRGTRKSSVNWRPLGADQREVRERVVQVSVGKHSLSWDGKCKGPVAAVCLAYLKRNNEASLASTAIIQFAYGEDYLQIIDYGWPRAGTQA